MVTTVTAARTADLGAPQVAVTVSGLGGSAVAVAVETSWDGGATWQPVRGGRVASVLGATVVRDYLPALNVPVVYRATVAGVATVSAPLTVVSDTAWMQDPLAPRTALPVTGMTDPGGQTVYLLSPSLAVQDRPLPVDLALPMGASVPVASVGTRRAPSGMSLALRTAAQAQSAVVKALDAVVGSAGIFVLRGLPADLDLPPVLYLLAADLRRSAVVTGLLGDRRDWVMTVDQVRGPSTRVAIPWWTYDQVKAAWQAALGVSVTYDQANAARPGWTYVQWLISPTP